ncbi:Intracellular distribution of mitochondria [Coemansia sp. RSA 1086]|nr:Intracellular distribution of mitochondria [Coemansia sp. RSA 1086]
MARAVVVSERTVGLDNPLTIHNYLNLALYEHARGNTLLALRFFRSCLDICRHLLGNEHILVANAQHSLAKALAIERHLAADQAPQPCLDPSPIPKYASSIAH